MHHKCNSAKHRIISPKVDPRSGGYSSAHSEVQNNDVSEGKTEHSSHGGGKCPGGGAGGGSAREKRNGKVHKPALLHQNSTEVSSTNQVEVPDTTQNSPVSISSGLNSDPDMADSPVVTGMSHVASVMSGLPQSVFMSEVTGDPVYSMSPTGGPNSHLMGADATSQGLVLSDRHKFAFPSATVGEPGTTAAGDSLSILSTAGVSEELVLSSSLDSGSIKIPETNMNFDPDCFLNNPKQGQTYGGSAMKTEGNSSASSSSGNSSSTNGGLQRSPSMSDGGYTFSSALVKNIKTEDTSFEQQLAKESGYQVGGVVSCGSGVSVSSSAGSGQSSLTLTPTGSLLPSGGGLSPSTTLEQMDFSAIDAKQDYTSSATSVSFGQAMSSPHMQNQSRSPNFFLQDASQTAQAQQGRPNIGQKTHLMEHNSHDSGAYMGLQVVKTDSPGSNGHLHHHHHQAHQAQHRANCNGGSPPEGSGRSGSLQLLQYQGAFPGLSAENEEVVALEQPGGVHSSPSGGAENGTENLLKPGDHIQACGAGSGELGGRNHYLQQTSDNGGGGAAGAGEAAIHNGNNNGDGSNCSQQQQQLQPLLQGPSMVQGLYNTHQGLGGASSNGGTGGAGMEINLDHFDISFGNQFSDLINDFISVDGNGATMSASGALYAHQLVTSHSSDSQNAAGGGPGQGQEDGGTRGSGYNPSELCLQSCCSPQSLSGGAGGGGSTGEAGSLSYMTEVVSAAVAQGMGMLQATGRLFMVTDYSPEWSYPEVSDKI